ncbi:MAG: hypothetical protein CO132_04790 [Candidatus Kerfeldbacteria bacterium CG_4_9_14_3_um_filter_45_8]|nr:MAG: hypothetical protein CO132_04790 [Candidatus Kerfeldbacteria bacterium CG_4_9_14_3_um_filter_45_8]
MDKVKEYFGESFRVIPFWWVVFGIGCFEVLSFAGQQFAELNTASFFVILTLVLIYSLKDLKIGVAVVLVELFVSSKGYLFSWEVAGFDLSFRLALFLVLWAAYLVWIIRERKVHFFSWAMWKEYSALMVVVAMGVLIGVLRGNDFSNVFFDGNGYLYLGLIGPLTQAIRKKYDVQRLLSLLLASVVAVGIKTIILLALFSQAGILLYTLPGIYHWVRDTGVGEITRFDNGFSRIFFQGHIYALLVFFFLSAWLVYATGSLSSLRSRYIQGVYLLWALTILIIFLSYSRSFWMATIAGLGLVSVWLLVRERVPFRRIFLLGVLLFVTFAIDYGVAFGIVNIPLPGHGGVGARELLTDRAKDIESESAAASRWQLIEPLSRAAISHPLLGSGLGTTVTYQSEDPRVVAQTGNGRYTTFSFEWGYLDLLLKFGIIGFAIYGYLFYSLWQHGIAQMGHGALKRVEVIGVLSATLGLLLVHVFTPYLNHPLGIGWLLLASLLVTIPPHKSTLDV